MAKHPFRIGGNRQPALDVVSYGRRGSGRPERFTSEQVAQIARTVRRAPEVMVKVSGGGNSLGAVAAHFRYITRKGTLELERDDGERGTGRWGAAEPSRRLGSRDRPRDRPVGPHDGRPTGVHGRITSCCRCRPKPRLRNSSQRAGNSPERSSQYSTGMPWFCTPTRIIPMCI